MANLIAQWPVLHAESDSSFFAKREEWRVTFHTNEDGNVTELVLDSKGTRNRFARGQEDVPPPAMVAGNVPVSMEDIARYVGTYDLQIGGRALRYRVFGEDGRLMSQLGQTVSPLVRIGEHEFVVVVNPTIRVVFNVENGQAESVTLHQGSRSDPGDRR